MGGDSATLVVKTYKSFKELEDEAGFKPDNPVSAENYRRICGDYYFDPQIRCCFRKSNGELCAHWHNSGFVARLKDDTLTVVGNKCARDKFGADSSIKADSAKYLNEKRRQELLARLAELLASREETTGRFAALRARLRDSENNVQAFLDSLGPQTRMALTALARSGSGRVSVRGVRIRRTKEKDGTISTERQFIPLAVGTLAAVSAVRTGAFRALYDEMTKIYQAYGEGARIAESPKAAELELLAVTLAGAPLVESDGEELLGQVQTFLAGDLLPLCYLSADKVERFNAARVVARIGKDKAKDWLAAKDRELIALNSVDRLDF